MSELNTIADIITWAAEREVKNDMPLKDHIELVDAASDFVTRVRPLYERYNTGIVEVKHGNSNKMR